MPTDPPPYDPTDPGAMTAEEWRATYFAAAAIAQSELDRLRSVLRILEADAIRAVYAARAALEPSQRPDRYPPHAESGDRQGSTPDLRDAVEWIADNGSHTGAYAHEHGSAFEVCATCRAQQALGIVPPPVLPRRDRPRRDRSMDDDDVW